MEKETKKFHLYVFLSTFARSIIEVFIPLLLYKFGYSLHEVIVYFTIYNLIELAICYPITKMAIKVNNKMVAAVGFVCFILSQIVLNNMVKSIWYLVILACLYAFYRTCYWLSRRYYNMRTISKEHVSISYSVVAILNQIAVLIAGYVGAIFLDLDLTKFVTISAIIIYILSFIPLCLIKEKNDEDNNKVKIDIKNTLKSIGFRKIYLFGTYELINVLKFLFTLYIYIYVKETFKTVGFLNLVTNLSIMIFAYTFAKKIDKEDNKLSLIIILVVITLIFKLNITSVWMILVCFVEGLVIKAYEVSINKEVFETSKNIEYNNYNLVYQMNVKIFRSVLLGICLLLGTNLRAMIYLGLIFILIGISLGNDKKKIEE